MSKKLIPSPKPNNTLNHKRNLIISETGKDFKKNSKIFRFTY